MNPVESPRDFDESVVRLVNEQWMRLVFHVPPGCFEYAAQDAGVSIELTERAQLVVGTPSGTFWVLDDGVMRLQPVAGGHEIVGFADGSEVSRVVVPGDGDENPNSLSDHEGD